MAGARHRTGAALSGGRVRRIGLLGGSFNPAHDAHRRISLFARTALGLDEIWWLVSPGNPLKPAAGMAPLAVRFAAAAAMARRAPIRPTTIEAGLGTRFTADTLAALLRRYPGHDFIWLMGADNLEQFARWHDWRRIARTLPIAVIARPGYDAPARRSEAMGWLGRFVRPAGDAKRWTQWSLPAIVLLHTVPDPMSATARRAADPLWARRFQPRALRDSVTRRPVSPEVHCLLPPPAP
ncbi:nicotinate-nucleotide adenylyltransferase [Sphingomonas morindae]|uniref:Probable nicotinate-nucleotide adenylyltransferase n=1 Tax=Sphingomonas morindae TaxID=1541170 RepID=A0ABY4X9L0_9SPHN|nr:nicotinate-nucleotide adenylyltransferase [Sphingomonas morindae]USI73599.1 nicotinate-nucleotide adenylyltransferase [Sphingomonas morindae]